MDEIRDVLREVLGEFQQSALEEERKKRGELEQRIQELTQRTEEAERSASVRAELQRLGVAKIDLAYRAVRDDVFRSEEGHLMARNEQGGLGLKEYLAQFVEANPEFLPARIAGGSGSQANQRPAGPGSGGVDLDRIKPGMSGEELEKVRHEISRIASQTLRGL
ncbi:MAG: hypothetical protein ABI823_07600 [Bryobacteraceae bacterium]